jgi:hypothetical protein
VEVTQEGLQETGEAHLEVALHTALGVEHEEDEVALGIVAEVHLEVAKAAFPQVEGLPEAAFLREAVGSEECEDR